MKIKRDFTSRWSAWLLLLKYSAMTWIWKMEEFNSRPGTAGSCL
jgi:hypothetical protein